MRTLLLATVVGSVACASTQATSTFVPRPMVASLQPVAPAPSRVAPDIAPEAEPIDEELAPGLLLQRGLHHFASDEHRQAASAFRAAVGTGRLNTAGRALAYWHIFVSEKRRRQMAGSYEALSSFVTVAEDLMAMRDDVQYAVTEGGDFVDQFDIERKLDHGRAVLSASWAGRSDTFGRSMRQPVPVYNQAEMAYFLQVAAPCEGERRSVARREIEGHRGEALQRITLSCGDEEQVEYYFDVR